MLDRTWPLYNPHAPTSTSAIEVYRVHRSNPALDCLGVGVARLVVALPQAGRHPAREPTLPTLQQQKRTVPNSVSSSLFHVGGGVHSRHMLLRLLHDSPQAGDTPTNRPRARAAITHDAYPIMAGNQPCTEESAVAAPMRYFA